MSRKLWLIIGVAALFILLLCAAGVWGAVLYRARQIDQSLEFANAHFAAGEWGLAKNHFRRYLAEHPKDVEALGKYALACVNTLEDRPKALRDATIAYYHIAINNPNDEAALRSLIELYEKRRAWNDLEYYAGYFIRRYPDRTWLKYERAVALDNMQRGEQAIEAYRELTEAGAAYADVYGNLARLLYGDGLRDEAQAVLEEAEARFPDAALIRLQWPRYYLGIEDVERAGETIQEVLDLAPNDPEVLSVAARVAVARKQWQEAALFCEQALKQRPDRAETYLVLAGAYQKIGEVAKTLSLLENMDPLLRVDYPEFFLFHHDLLILEERFEEARRVLDEYRAAYPGHAVMFDYMEARELLAKGEATRASVVLTTVVESNPNFAPAQYYQAVAYLQSYKRDRAWNVLVRLLRNFPDDERARALYERAFGRDPAAEDATETARLLLADPTASAGSLVSAAGRLITEKLRRNGALVRDTTVESLLEASIKRDPSHAAAYALLADVACQWQDVAGARNVLARAAAAGVPEAELYLTRAGVALAENDVPGALELFGEATASNTTVDEVVRWANSFAARGHLEAALTLLSGAVAASPPEDVEALEFEEVALCARFGAVEQALGLLSGLESRPGMTPERRRAVNEQKEQLVYVLISPEPGGDPAEAARLADELRRDEPGNRRFQLLYGRVLLSQNPPDYAGARAMATPLLESNPSDSDALTALADIALREGDVMVALDYASRAAASNPQDASTQLFLAEIQMRAQRFLEAQIVLENVLTLRPEDGRAMELLARAYIATDRLRQAEAMLARFERVVQESPGKAGTLELLRGKVRVARGENVREVEQALRRRYVADPDDAEVLRELALVVARQGRAAESEQLVKAYAENHSDSADAWVMLGRHYLASNSPHRQMNASSAFTRALLVQTDYPPALRGLIELHMRANNRAEALALCERYLKFRPSDPEVLYRKAFLLARLGRSLAEALASVEAALDIAERSEYVYLRGTLNLALGNHAKALEDLQRVKQSLELDSAELDLALAEAYLGVGESGLAAQYCASARRRAVGTTPATVKRIERIEALLDTEEDDS